jgi:hypothetical protein
MSLGSSNSMLPQPCVDMEGDVNDRCWPDSDRARPARTGSAYREVLRRSPQAGAATELRISKAGRDTSKHEVSVVERNQPMTDSANITSLPAAASAHPQSRFLPNSL